MPEQSGPFRDGQGSRPPLRSISHSRYELLRQCELKAARSAGEGSRPASIPSVLGRIAHTALELLARRSPTPLVERPSPAAVGRICDEAWDEAEQFESQKREVAALIEGSGKPPTWNQYHEQKLFLVRLFHVTAEWLVSIDAQKGDLLPEQELTSPRGTSTGNWISTCGAPSVPFWTTKTGNVQTDGQLKRDIREQLQLYAWLVAQAEEVAWPRSARRGSSKRSHH